MANKNPNIIHMLSAGSYLPKRVISNDALSRTVDTNDEWIRTRSGITQRYFASADETVTYMATEAAKDALQRAGVSPQDVGLIIVATTTPDYVFPAVAVRVQRDLGALKAAAFDVQAVCGGFVYGLATAKGLLATGATDASAPYTLIIGADRLSSILDMTDRSTCVLFGDGAGAALLRTDANSDTGGIIDTLIRSDGSKHDILYAEGGAAATAQGPLKMDGKEVFRYAGALMSEAIKTLLERNALASGAISHLVPHQANSRIMQKAAALLNIPEDRVLSYVEQHANTSAASIPLALAAADSDKRLNKGDLLALTALGGGLSWGAALCHWG